MRVLPPCVKVSIVDTGVAKSATSSRRSRLRGNAVFRKSTTSVRPCWRISMPVVLSDRSTMMRPSPFLPRRKSTSRRVCATSPGRASAKRDTTRRFGAAAAAAALIGQGHQHGVAFDVGLEGLRLVEVEHHAGAVARLDDVDAAQGGVANILRRAAQAVAGIGKIERNARRVGDGEIPPAGSPAGAFSVNLITVRPELALDTFMASMLLGVWAPAGDGNQSSQRQRDQYLAQARPAWGSGRWQGAHRLRSCR